MYPQERFACHKKPYGLSFASKGLGNLAALLLLLSLLARYKLSCYQTSLLHTISALADIVLLKTTCHFLVLLVGFDTLTYRKELQLIPYTCGSSSVGNGRSIRFWEDIWHGNAHLATQFWDLYFLVNEKNKSIPEIWDGHELKCSFGRTFSDELRVQWFDLVNILELSRSNMNQKGSTLRNICML